MGSAIQLSGYSTKQIALIKRTVAKDTNDDEFNLFMEAARAYRLDPFRKQISAIVFNAGKADKRQMAIIVSRDGHRIMAQRCQDYRPASEPTRYETDPSLKSKTNPHGLISATVTLYKQDNKGQWHPVIGEAFWDEFAPVKDEWAYDPAAGSRKPTGEQTLDGTWARMPRLMLAKCAESQALRAGWPDQFSGTYAEEELHKAEMDLTATEAVAKEEENARIARLGGRSINFTFDDTGVLEAVKEGNVADRISEHVKKADPETLYRWQIQNRVGLQEFWALSPGDALEVKKAIEAKLKDFNPGEAA